MAFHRHPLFAQVGTLQHLQTLCHYSASFCGMQSCIEKYIRRYRQIHVGQIITFGTIDIYSCRHIKNYILGFAYEIIYVMFKKVFLVQKKILHKAARFKTVLNIAYTHGKLHSML